jgi:hypothetical protein
MKRILMATICITTILLAACNNGSGGSMNVQDVERSLEVVIYPSGGGTSGYRLLKKGNILTAMVTRVEFENSDVVLGDVISERKMSLSKQQIGLVEDLIDELTSGGKFIEESLVLDAWVFVIYLDKQEMVKFYGWPSKTVPPHIRKLMEYLLYISPINVNLEHSA